MAWQTTREAVFLGVAGVSDPVRVAIVFRAVFPWPERPRPAAGGLKAVFPGASWGLGPSSDLLAVLTVAKEVRPCVGGGRPRPGLGVGGGPALPGLRLELDHNPVINF
ncbi:MAG: hypothetical protein A2W72_11790 [Burkholderiales bacterium RIFCSPLOWO2_12_67_14]|nr:MAG: hypothetical protein A3I64_24000 [Burkholderiales bacterium RIFCSPLOWO2_02_FULL_67_64]OGB44746.1 MAG: hypothetical protein A2W72_11790 [Burkholderiales bacterium RIFCSPLOWO2_12_67_14]OGB50762.1 MAG: hypothetical protein A3E51_10050 [Burkholderiales bacterium RIFCSPHIGHO2_12_FULL_67_38]OGC02365.1 MAG: hypothetical protein A3G82_20925 [Burkholderiales bacterium RIFCSPLOWO2_12_FULL_67_210]